MLLPYFLPLLFSLSSITSYLYKTHLVDVPVDHFSFSDNQTFKLRVLINDTYWKNKKHGPIFFYTGNEGDIEMFAQNTGFMWEIAKRFKALVVFAEHRYYGNSLPFGNSSFKEPKYFGYLTSEQALADYVDVLYYIRSGQWRTNQEKLSPDQKSQWKQKTNPVIAFGGSYGGMLAAWFRMKYPSVVEGALASSAPIWQFTGMTPCDTFYKVTTSSYLSSGYKQCIPNIKKSWNIITKFGSTAKGTKWLEKNWHLCSQLKNESDVQTLKYWLRDVYVNVAMTNYPYETNFLMPLPANPVKVMCSRLNNHPNCSEESLLESVFDAVTVYFNSTGSAKCLDVTTETSSSLGDDGWNIQSCMEMVMPLCSDGEQDMFEKIPWNYEAMSEECYRKYGVKPSLNYVEKQYGGKDIRTASNIIFSNGLLDPWSSGGVLYNVSESTYAIVIAESAHHLDLRESNQKDPLTIRRARGLYKHVFKKWLKDYYKRIGFHSSHPHDVGLDSDDYLEYEEGADLLRYHYRITT